MIYMPYLLGILLIYAFVKNRLLHFVQPLRLKAADLGEEALADERLPSEDAASLTFFLNNAYNGFFPLITAAIFPIAAVMTLMEKIRGVERRPPAEGPPGAQATRAIDLLMAAHALANPVAGALIVVEIFLFVVIIALCNFAPNGVEMLRYALFKTEKLERRFGGSHGLDRVAAQ